MHADAADAVRADETQPTGARGRYEVVLERPSCRTGLGEPAGADHDREGPRADAVVHGLTYSICGEHDHDEIDRGRAFGDGAIRRKPPDGRSIRPNRIERPRVAETLHELDRQAAECRRTVRGPHNCY